MLILTYALCYKNLDFYQESTLKLTFCPKKVLGCLSVMASIHVELWRVRKSQLLFWQKIVRQIKEMKLFSSLCRFISLMDLEVRKTSMCSGKCFFFPWNEAKDLLQTDHQFTAARSAYWVKWRSPLRKGWDLSEIVSAWVLVTLENLVIWKSGNEYHHFIQSFSPRLEIERHIAPFCRDQTMLWTIVSQSWCSCQKSTYWNTWIPRKAEKHSEYWNPSWTVLNNTSQKTLWFIPGTTSCLSAKMQKAYHSGQMNEVLMGQRNLK